MDLTGPDVSWQRWVVRLVVAWTTGMGLSPGLAQSAGPADPGPASGVLDGRQFAGTFGPADGGDGRLDTLYFGDGRFWSANCVPCGFVPALYWVRHEGDSIHFRGEMRSRERGRFSYVGVIRGDRIEADVRWQKARWYWTIDRSFRFVGRRADGPAGGSAAVATQRAVAAGVEPEPTAVCPL